MELDKSLKLLVFDFDGTLFNLGIDWEKLRRELGVSPDESKSLGEIIQTYAAGKHPDLEKVTKAELDAIGSARLSADIVTALKKLQQQDHMLAVLTRNSRLAVQEVLKDTGLEDDIYIIGREDVKMMKPDPEGLQLMLRHFGCRPEQTALVGDTYHDVEAAKAAGIAAIIVRNPRLAFQPQGADLYIESISELVG